MKSKSESNLAQRFDFVAVDIPIDGEPEVENKNEREIQLIANEPDETNKEEDLTNSGQRGRRPSVFEEGLKEFYDKTTAENKNDIPTSPEITLEDLDAISGQTTQ